MPKTMSTSIVTVLLLSIFGALNNCGNSPKKTATQPSSVDLHSPTESITFVKDYAAYSVSLINNCGKHITTTPKRYPLYKNYDADLQNQTILNMTGWNHATNGNTTEWTALKLSAMEYNSPTIAKANNSCNHIDTLDMILLKKHADWNHQHSNGIEFHIPAQTIHFEQVESIVIDLKINSAKTMLPSMSSLENIYSPFVPVGVLRELDSNLVNIGFTFSDDTTLKASTIIELDQNLLFDRWIRVAVNMNKLAFYSEVNYVRTPKLPTDLSVAQIRSVLVVAETRTGLVLRSHMKTWSNSVPETFKEMDLSFKKIEFILK
jgi:hypothetical protein